MDKIFRLLSIRGSDIRTGYQSKYGSTISWRFSISYTIPVRAASFIPTIYNSMGLFFLNRVFMVRLGRTCTCCKCGCWYWIKVCYHIRLSSRLLIVKRRKRLIKAHLSSHSRALREYLIILVICATLCHKVYNVFTRLIESPY